MEVVSHVKSVHSHGENFNYSTIAKYHRYNILTVTTSFDTITTSRHYYILPPHCLSFAAMPSGDTWTPITRIRVDYSKREKNPSAFTPLDTYPPFNTRLSIGDYVILVFCDPFREVRAQIGRMYLMDGEDVILGVCNTNPTLPVYFIRVDCQWVKMSLSERRSYQDLRSECVRFTTLIEEASSKPQPPSIPAPPQNHSTVSRMLRKCRSMFTIQGRQEGNS
jgi:hypothetical protein